MTRWKTILVPADFSPTARGALMLACEVARDAQGRIVLLHVAQLPSGLTMESMVRPRAGAELVPVGAYLETAAREELARLAQSAREAWPDVAIEMRVQFGAPSAVILETITSLAPDLVVVGTHGRTGFAHLMLGSVAELIVRSSLVPVLTVRVPAGDELTGEPTRELEEPEPSVAAAAVRATFQG